METQQVTIGGLLLAAVGWLVRRLAVAEKKLDDSRNRESNLRDLRTEELVSHAKELALNNVVINDALQRHDAAVASLKTITLEHNTAVISLETVTLELKRLVEKHDYSK